MATLRSLADEGLTIVCTTHTLETAELFDRALVLAGGHLVAEGSPRELRQRFGLEALKWIGEDDALRLRGINCSVVEAGRVRRGDALQPQG